MEKQEAAKEIVKRLAKAGHVAYFAGGWVRDHLMGRPCYDIDIATDAPMDEILDLFPRTIPIGLAFGVALVLVDGHQFEVSTFRRDIGHADGRRPERIEPASPREDALRRDFTINGMFYNPLEEVIYDFVGGQEDLKRGLIRTIGDPYERFFEDRLRMIRAVRFAHRFGFQISEETQEAIRENSPTLFPSVAMERIWQEFEKMAKQQSFGNALAEMYQLGLLALIFPSLEKDGLHLIRTKVSSFAHFPPESPTLFYLLELFPDASINQIVEICRYLKASNRDIKLAELISLGRNLAMREELSSSSNIDNYEWAHFYSHPDGDLCLKVIAARYAEGQREQFLARHADRQKLLLTHIQRLQLGKPLVTAALLQTHGLLPGKPMGLLLKEAERMVINHNRNNAEEVIELLKQSSNWPTLERSLWQFAD